MVPTNGEGISENWFRSLVNHDPDYIMICGDLDNSWKRILLDRIQPFALWVWNDKVLSKHLSHEGIVGSVSIEYILTSLYKRNRPITQSNICIPRFDVGSPFHLHAVAKYGLLPQPYQEYVASQLKGEYKELSFGTLGDYLEYQIQIAAKLTPIKVSTFGLNTHSENGGPFGFHIVLSGRSLVQDFSLFWNYRMQTSFHRQEILFLPVSSLRGDRDISDLADFCRKYVIGTDFFVLASASVSKKRLITITDRLKTQLVDSKLRHIDIQFSNFVTGKFRTVEKTKVEEVTVSDGYFRIRNFLPDFDEFARYADNSKWAVDIQFQAEGQRHSEYIPPKFPSLNRLLSGDPDQHLLQINRGFNVRLANGQLSYRAGVRQGTPGGYLPPVADIFRSLVQDKGFSSVESEKSKYVLGIEGLLGNLDNATSLRDIRLQNLIRQMADGGVFTPKNIKRILRPGKKQEDIDALYGLVTELSVRSVLLRGLKIQCPACDLTRWYPIDNLSERMRCAGCLTEFQPPIEAPFYYKLNELFSRGIKQGALPVLLTLTFLEKLSTKSFMYRPGLLISDDREVDIDVIASCDGQLILAECKDLHQNVRDDVSPDVLDQLNKVVEIARKLGAQLVFLSTLLPSTPKSLQSRIELLNNRAKGEIIVHLLTSEDLERGYKLITDEYEPTKIRAMHLADFMPKNSDKPQGWIREDGARSISF
jgi:hypothetical protein